MTPVLVFAFGAAIGSFLNVCIYRLPAEESVVAPASRCPRCRTPIAWYDNIPILSWLALRGRCRHCRERISARYPLVELLTGLAAVGLWLRVGFQAELLVLFVFLAALIVITFIDLDHQIIPDVISLPGIVVGFGVSFLGDPGPVASAIGIVTGGGILWAVAEGYARLTGREGMGGGDVKLLAMIGAFLGWKAIPFTLFVSSLTGSVIGVTLMWWKGSDMKFAIPFGPFLALGAVAWVFCGPEIVDWYLGLAR